MNRSLLSAHARVTVASLFLLVVVAGCPTDSNEYGLHELGIDRQALRDIEPLELEKAEPNQPPAEVNEAPPATLELSLEQSRALALENNLELQADLINPAIAAAQLSAEEAKFEAAFFANVNYAKSEVPFGTVTQISPGVLVPTVVPTRNERLVTDFGVQMPLRTGGTLTFDVFDTRTKDLMAEPNLAGPVYNDTFTASLSQPLLRNAGQWVSMYSIRLATYARDITDTRTRLEVIAVLAGLDRVYWRLYAARRELELREQQYQLAQVQLERARRLVAAQQRAQVEIIRAEAGVAEQLEAIIIAENAVRDRERELKRVIHKAGLDVQSPTALVLTTQPDPVRYALDRPHLVELAIANRMELLELQLSLLQDESNIRFARNQTLPLVTLNYTYGINGTGATRDDSFDLLFDSDFVDHRVGLQAVVPLGNEVAKNKLRQMIYQRRQRLATRASREDIIRLEVLNAVDQVEANWQRILAARQTAILTGRVYEAEQRQFEQGLRTSTDVLDAQLRFADAQSAEIFALADYQISLVDVAYATGTVLGAARVHWQPAIPETNVQ
jgi:outer membrane protein TolC